MGTVAGDRYRTAAGAIRRAEHGRQALAVARPRSVLGVVRARGPLRIMLRLADAEGRFVWRGPDSFVLLERPQSVRTPRSARGGIGLRVLRVIDRHWATLVFAVPPGLLLLVTAVAVAVAELTGAAVAPELVWLPVAATGYVCALLISQAVTESAWLRRTLGRRPPSLDEVAAESYPGWNWSVRLCHHTAPGSGKALLQQAAEQVSVLVRREAGEKLREAGAEADRIRVREVLVVPLQGVTTEAMRDTVRDSLDLPFGPGTRVALRRPTDPGQDLREPEQEGGGFLLYWIGGVAVVLAVLAVFVSSWERAACAAPPCPGRPVTFAAALEWLAWRLWFQNAPNIEPGTLRTSVIGWLVSAVGLMTVAVTVTAVRLAVRRNRRVVTAFRTWGASSVDTRILILTVTPAERDAVLAAVDRTPERSFAENLVIYEFGVLGQTLVGMVQCPRQSAGGAGGAQATAADAIRLWKPDVVLLVGTCCGLREDWTPPQKLADVVVASSVYDLDHRIEYDGRTELVGARVPTSSVLVARLQAASTDFRRATVSFGLVLSSRALLDSGEYRDKLKLEHSRALGYEMEAQGLHAACHDAGVRWIAVKAISDWGVERKKYYEPVAAAENAAAFVMHAIEETGGGGGLRGLGRSGTQGS